MTSIKRQLSNDVFPVEETKKLHTTIIKHKNSINCIENLSNELFYEIFDYLEGCSLYEAFSNLNTRLQRLLTSPLIQLKIIFTSNSNPILEHRSKFIVIPNRHQIVSFRFNNTIDRTQLFSWFSIDSNFSRLESLTLAGIQSDQLSLLLLGLTYLPCLFFLTIHLDQHSVDLSVIYKLILNLPKLKYNKLSSNVSETSISSSINSHSQFSPIESLIIDHSCNLNDLTTILSYTPRLSRLICKQLLTSNTDIGSIRSMTLTNLTHISILNGQIWFDEFEIFIKKISSQLKLLKFNTVRDTAYLNADRWEQLILQHIPYLYTFIFRYIQPVNEHVEITPYHDQINRFTSSFWIKKQWHFRLDVRTCSRQNAVLIYGIYPRRKRCVPVHDNKINGKCFARGTGLNSMEQIVVPFQQKPSASSVLDNMLCILRLPDMISTRSFFDMLRPMLLPSPINRIFIECNEIFIGTLIDFICLLPNLDFLSVRSLSMLQPRCLSVEEAANFRFVSTNNRITKVTLQQMKELAQVQFLIDLCPHMQHLDISCSDGVDPKLFLRFIFMKNVKYLPNLHSLCLRMSKPDEDTIEKLQKVIDVEKLRRVYVMKQKDNIICLVWKK